MPAPVMNHLWPLITQPSPFFSARVRIMAGSEPPPGAGSVMTKDERTSPSTMGVSHLSFCAVRADEREQIHVAVVGRLAVERHRAEDRAIGLLVHHRPADDRQRHAAVILRRLRRPQARGPSLGLQAAQHVEADVLVVVVVAGIGFERQHMLLDEAARAQADVLESRAAG